MHPQMHHSLSRRELASALLAIASSPPMAAGAQQRSLLPPVATFGVQIYDDATAERYTLQALEAGFRSFFTSPEGGNQLGFARAIASSGIPRNELYLSGSVLSDVTVGERAARLETLRACEQSRRALTAGGVERLDLLLLERPGIGCASIRGQWRALSESRATGWTQGLGVCNFEARSARAPGPCGSCDELSLSLSLRCRRRR